MINSYAWPPTSAPSLIIHVLSDPSSSPKWHSTHHIMSETHQALQTVQLIPCLWLPTTVPCPSTADNFLMLFKFCTQILQSILKGPTLLKILPSHLFLHAMLHHVPQHPIASAIASVLSKSDKWPQTKEHIMATMPQSPQTSLQLPTVPIKTWCVTMDTTTDNPLTASVLINSPNFSI